MTFLLMLWTIYSLLVKAIATCVIILCVVMFALIYAIIFVRVYREIKEIRRNKNE